MQSLWRLLLDRLSQSLARERGLFNWPEISRRIDEPLNRKANWGDEAWSMLTPML
jgi:hypothetical protein